MEATAGIVLAGVAAACLARLFVVEPTTWREMCRAAIAETTHSRLAEMAPHLVMWAAMTLVMTLPAAAIGLLRCRLARRDDRTVHAVSAFLIGYLTPWGAFVVAATALQEALAGIRLLSSGGMLHGTAGGLLLIAICLYQSTPWKRRALTQCRAMPLPSIVASGGAKGPLRHGFRQGLACLQACGVPMASMLVTGPMTTTAMAMLSLWLLGERHRRWGEALRLLGAAALLGWGGALVLAEPPAP